MSATLANMRINPITRQQVFGLEYVKDVLAVMFTCGLYDYAGEWAYRVGGAEPAPCTLEWLTASK